MIRQSGIEVSATLFAQKTIVLALRKSTDSCPVKKPPPLDGIGRVDKHVVPAGRRGGVALVVALGVTRRGADDAREAEARPDDALDQRQRAGVGGDPDRRLAVLLLDPL